MFTFSELEKCIPWLAFHLRNEIIEKVHFINTQLDWQCFTFIQVDPHCNLPPSKVKTIMTA